MGAAPPVIIDLDNYLCIKSITNPVVINFEQDLQYFLVDSEVGTVVNPRWNTLTAGVSIAVIPPKKIVFKANLTTLTSPKGIGTFSITGTADDSRCTLHGNCMSLLYGDDAVSHNTIPERAFASLFYNCTPIAAVNGPIQGNAFPTAGCFSQMFAYCENMVTGPYLFPYTAYERSYAQMFFGCKSLIETYGSFPHKVHPYSCFQMYYGCSSLKMHPDLPANGLDADRCYYQMYYGCSELDSISIGITSIGYAQVMGMLDGVAPSGDIYTVNNPNIKEALTPAGWTWHELT